MLIRVGIQKRIGLMNMKSLTNQCKKLSISTTMRRECPRPVWCLFSSLLIFHKEKSMKQMILIKNSCRYSTSKIVSRALWFRHSSAILISLSRLSAKDSRMPKIMMINKLQRILRCTSCKREWQAFSNMASLNLNATQAADKSIRLLTLCWDRKTSKTITRTEKTPRISQFLYRGKASQPG